MFQFVRYLLRKRFVGLPIFREITRTIQNSFATNVVRIRAPMRGHLSLHQ